LMKHYLINQNFGGEHYFYKPYEGICIKKRTPAGMWQEHSQVIALGREPFCVYQARDLSMHIVCVDAENRLVYAVRRNNMWKKYVLSQFSEDIFLSDIQIYSVRGRLNILYSALYNGENLLVHCILGNHAKPTTVSRLSGSHFFISDDKVYYTTPDGSLGFSDLSDEKPVFFNKLYDDAHFATLWKYENREFLIFIRNSHLFINGKDILRDERIENPIFIKGTDRIYIMWKSGGFIRYISSFNGGITWSESMRFINTGSAFNLYRFQSGNILNRYYGYEVGDNITLLGVSDIFENPVSFSESNELKSIKNQLDEKVCEAERAKQEVERLNKILSGLLP